jgi:hypothetical protein
MPLVCRSSFITGELFIYNNTAFASAVSKLIKVPKWKIGCRDDAKENSSDEAIMYICSLRMRTKVNSFHTETIPGHRELTKHCQI